MIHGLLALYVILILPESLVAARDKNRPQEHVATAPLATTLFATPEDLDETTALLAQSSRSPHQRLYPGLTPSFEAKQSASARRRRAIVKIGQLLLVPLRPLDIFMPRRQEDGNKLDWSLTVIAVVYYLIATVMVSPFQPCESGRKAADAASRSSL